MSPENTHTIYFYPTNFREHIQATKFFLSPIWTSGPVDWAVSDDHLSSTLPKPPLPVTSVKDVGPSWCWQIFPAPAQVTHSFSSLNLGSLMETVLTWSPFVYHSNESTARWEAFPLAWKNGRLESPFCSDKNQCSYGSAPDSLKHRAKSEWKEKQKCCS